MKIELHEISVRDLVDGYSDGGDEGVTGYGGRLDIRPPYQREFIYGERQRVAVVDSVMHGFPLNVMYWVRRGDGTFEIIDGQQRTISLCQFAQGDFHYDMRFFQNFTAEAEIARLVADSDVQRKSGIWEYVLDGDERHLNIRAFDGNTRLEAYERQHGLCAICRKHFELEEMEADHFKPWSHGGHTVPDNCQMLCRDCNRHKGAK